MGSELLLCLDVLGLGLAGLVAGEREWFSIVQWYRKSGLCFPGHGHAGSGWWCSEALNRWRVAHDRRGTV
jgi:hypothetical protein